MKIVICCNKRDIYLTKICVASIRYYYPEVDIYILRDFLNGDFDTAELEKAMNVKVLDLGIKKYGWSAAKMHLLFSNQFPGEKVMTLDSDIVFTGKFLEKLFSDAKDFDFVINADYYSDPYSDWVRRHYYDMHYLKSIDPVFEFPGYLFNGGQMIITTGMLKQEEVIDFFDLSKFPYWKQVDKMPLVDQSLLNYMLPRKEQKGDIKILPAKFMLWSESKEVKEMELSKIKEGTTYLSIIHWAGALRIPHIAKMNRADILLFFEDYYYKQIPFGSFKKATKRAGVTIDYYLRAIYRKTVKKILHKN